MAQTGKLSCRIPAILYGPAYWNEIVNFQALRRHGMIAEEDLGLFRYANDPAMALRLCRWE